MPERVAPRVWEPGTPLWPLDGPYFPCPAWTNDPRLFREEYGMDEFWRRLEAKQARLAAERAEREAD
jgi:hypothetical protein